MDALGIVQFIHVRSAGVLVRQAHFRQVFPLLFRPFPALRIRCIGQALYTETFGWKRSVIARDEAQSPSPAFIPRGLCRHKEAASRESRHSRFAVPSPLNPFWLHIWEFLMASRMRGLFAFLRLSLLECSPYSLHLFISCFASVF